MNLKEIEIGRTIDEVQAFLEFFNSKIYIIRFKNDDLDLDYLRKLKIKIYNNKIIKIKINKFSEKYIIKYLDNEYCYIIKKVNDKIQFFEIDYMYINLYFDYFKCLKYFLTLNNYQQRNIVNQTYY